MKLIRIPILVLAILALAAVSAPAQIVINPTTVECIASADHNTMFEGQPVLTTYRLELFLQGGTTPAKVIDLGKPTPGTGGLITIVNPAYFVMAVDGAYTGQIVAVGPGGEGRSEMSNIFLSIHHAPGSPGKPAYR